MGSKHGLQMLKLRMDRHKREISKSGIGGRIQLWRCSALKERGEQGIEGLHGRFPFLSRLKVVVSMQQQRIHFIQFFFYVEFINVRSDHSRLLSPSARYAAGLLVEHLSLLRGLWISTKVIKHLVFIQMKLPNIKKALLLEL